MVLYKQGCLRTPGRSVYSRRYCYQTRQLEPSFKFKSHNGLAGKWTQYGAFFLSVIDPPFRAPTS